MRPIEEYFLGKALLPASRAVYERSVMIRPIPDLNHYTSFESCTAILRTKTIWATECRCLNDSSELSYSEAVIRDEVQQAAGRCSPAVRDFLFRFSYVVQYMAGRMRINIASFSERGDSLSQWNAYAREGVSIGISGTALQVLPDCHIVKVTYDPDLQRKLVGDTVTLHVPLIEAAFEAADQNRVVQASGLLATQLSLYASAFKNPSFEDEREWRMITGAAPKSLKVRHTAGWEQPYVELSLEVELGGGIPLVSVRHSPYLEPSTGAEKVGALLQVFGLDPGMACASQVPLRLRGA